MAQSFIRRMKRQAKREAGLTFTERLQKAVRTGQAVSRVEHEISGSPTNRRMCTKEVV